MICTKPHAAQQQRAHHPLPHRCLVTLSQLPRTIASKHCMLPQPPQPHVASHASTSRLIPTPRRHQPHLHPHKQPTFAEDDAAHAARTSRQAEPPRHRIRRHATHGATCLSRKASLSAQTRSWLLVHPAQSGSVFCSPRTSEGRKSDRAANSLLLIASAPQAAGLVGRRMAAVISLISPPNPIESKSAQQSGHELAYAR